MKTIVSNVTGAEIKKKDILFLISVLLFSGFFMLDSLNISLSSGNENTKNRKSLFIEEQRSSNKTEEQYFSLKPCTGKSRTLNLREIKKQIMQKKLSTHEAMYYKKAKHTT